MDLEQLRRYDSEGFLPGPSEGEEAFIARVTACRCAHAELDQLFPAPYELDPENPIIEEAMTICRTLYNVEPRWVPILFSNYSLAPWQGACTWIVQKDESSPPVAFVQLRRNFLRSKKLLGLYDGAEVLAHELCHAVRMAFDEPRYEELLAYQTSSSPFQRIVGPLFQSENEVLAFIAAIATPLCVILLFLWGAVTESLLMYSYLVPFAFVSIAAFRLLRRHRALRRCLRYFLLHGIKDSARVIFRLSDSNIDTCSKIILYFQDEKHV